MEHLRLSVSWILQPPNDLLLHGRKVPIYLLVPGFTGTNATMSILGGHLAERANVAYAPEFSHLNIGSFIHSGRKLAERLRKLLDTDGLSRDVKIVAYSNGWLIALEALRNDPSLKIGELITMGTPFYGTPLAYPLSFLIPACNEVNKKWWLNTGYDFSRQIRGRVNAHVSHRDSIVPPRSQFPGEFLAPGKTNRVDHPEHTHTCFVIWSGARITANKILWLEEK